MTSVKEVITVNSRPPETIGEEQNSFLSFIDQNRNTLDRHAFLTYELRDEEAGWKNSPTVDSLVDMGIVAMNTDNPRANMLKGGRLRQAERQVRDNITRIIFSNTHEKSRFADSILPQALSTRRRTSLEAQALLETIKEANEDFRARYNEAISPLVSGIRESNEELMGKFEEFLLSNPSNIFAFADFLSDKKNNGARIEAIRPFLSSLADSEQSLARERKEGVFRRAARKWVDELKEKPNPATIDKFVPSIKSPNVLEWLRFAVQRGGWHYGIANFLKSIPISIWPTELKDALSLFVSSRYFTSFVSIERELGEFRRPSISKQTLSLIDFELEDASRTPGKKAVNTEQDGGDEAPEAAERSRYPVGILTQEIGSSFGVRILTEGEFKRLLQKEADSLDPADQRMTTDLEKIFLSLQEDPYGLGTEKLKVRSIVIGHREFPLRSFNPGKRIGLSHDHPDSHDIRIAYIICKNNGVPVIGLKGVYKHTEYMRTFKLAK